MSEFNIRDIKLGEDVTADAIHEDLEFLDDWEERYRYIIDLGKQLPAMPEELRTEERQQDEKAAASRLRKRAAATGVAIVP